MFRRLVSVVWAVWFSVVGFEPAAFGACPMHASGAQVNGSAGEHARGHDVGHRSGQQRAPSCHCSGNCCGPTVVAGLPSVLLVAIGAEPLRIHVATACHFYVVRGDFVLPFANAPPDARSV